MSLRSKGSTREARQNAEAVGKPCRNDHRLRALCDLDDGEDSNAEVDANVVMTGEGGLVEVQATAERTPLSRAHLDELLALAAGGIEQLRGVQEQAIAA